MILADTSVWIDHFRLSDPVLVEGLEVNGIAMHPAVLGELSCGNLRNRTDVLIDLQALPRVAEAKLEECLHLIEVHQLYGKGMGWIDVQLLASARLKGIPLWTRDRRLRSAAVDLGLGCRTR